MAEESERVVAAGAPLVELSNTSLEIVIEVLSIDAVKVKPGSPVLIDGWGGEQALEARIRLVEPSAFTKISAMKGVRRRWEKTFPAGAGGQGVAADRDGNARAMRGRAV